MKRVALIKVYGLDSYYYNHIASAHNSDLLMQLVESWTEISDDDFEILKTQMNELFTRHKLIVIEQLENTKTTDIINTILIRAKKDREKAERELKLLADNNKAKIEKRDRARAVKVLNEAGVEVSEERIQSLMKNYAAKREKSA